MYFTKHSDLKIRVIKNEPHYYWEVWDSESSQWNNKNGFNTSIDLLEEAFTWDTPAAQVLYGS